MLGAAAMSETVELAASASDNGRTTNELLDQPKPKPAEYGDEIGIHSQLPFSVAYDDKRWEEFRHEDESSPTVRQLVLMRRTDGQARALYRLLTLPIRSALRTSTFVPAEGGDKEAEFIDGMFNLPAAGGGMQTPFNRVMAQMLMCVFDGFSAFEQVYWSPSTGPLKGKVTLKKLAYRSSETITFLTDEQGEFAGLRQRANLHGKYIDIAIDKEDSFYVAAQEEERPHYGVSFFQSAFHHYDKKIKLYYIAHLSAQRHAVGMRDGTWPVGSTEKEKGAFKRALADVGIAQFIAHPENFKVSLLTEQGSFDFLSYINHHNSQMSKSVLAAFFDSNQGGGSSDTSLVNFGEQSDSMFILMLQTIMDEMASAINDFLIPKFVDWNFGTDKYPTFTWGTFCITEDAEALTRDRGWVTHHDLRSGDTILSYDPATGRTCWEEVQEVHRFPGTHEVVRWKSNSLEVVTTPEHRWLTEGPLSRAESALMNRTVQGNVTRVMRTRQLSEDPRHLLHVKVGSGGNTDAFGEIETYSTAFVNLIGWMVTEGWFKKQSESHPEPPPANWPSDRPWKGRGGSNRGVTQVFLSQSQTANPTKVEAIRVMLSELTGPATSITEQSQIVKYNDSTMITFTISGELALKVREVCGPDKQLTPEFLASLTHSQAEALLATLIAADGNIPSDRPNARKFIQKDRGRCNAFVALCAMLGYRTSKIEREDGVTSIRVLSGTTVRSTDLSPQNEVYTGTVWCPSLRTGMWIVRVNGRTFITGNTDDQKQLIQQTFDKLAAAGQGVNVTPQFLRQLEIKIADEIGLEIDYEEIQKEEDAAKAAAEAASAQADTGFAGALPDPTAPVDPNAPAGAPAPGEGAARLEAPLGGAPPVGLSGAPISESLDETARQALLRAVEAMVEAESTDDD